MKFNEFFVGQRFETDSIKVTKEKIMEFASEFDPQYMHLDEKKTQEGMFGGIIASGIQTLALTFKLWVECGLYGEDVVAGTAMDNIRFIKPVYPDDELHVVVEVINLEDNRKNTGIVTVNLSTFNHTTQKIFEGELSVIIKK
ncbi:MaoC family dehydratase [Paenibacillus polymyxa]|uniref:MaoC family dehydratase n=1 Tax=Paenibacillus polymyxa TaxID=1406 RepID=UPI002379A367|nr:MaoC family dehydratase [Paenibacillus polymyxa]WDM22686.1 MaoC family dehydratase [Paenibacillus polymyxa]